MAPFRYTPIHPDEKNTTSDSTPPPRAPRPYGRRALHPLVIGVASIIIVAVCGALVGTKVYKSKLHLPIRDPQSIFPKFATIRRTFFQDDGHQPPDFVWDNILPHGLGFVTIPNPRLYDLPPSMPADPSVDTGDAEVYGMALWHQLHCLRDLRAALRFHRDEITPTHAMVSDDHADHCFDYLRQTLECHGDTTIEWGHLFDVDGVVSGAINGYGIPHQCRDYLAIRSWTADSRSSNRTHGEDDPE